MRLVCPKLIRGSLQEFGVPSGDHTSVYLLRSWNVPSFLSPLRRRLRSRGTDDSGSSTFYCSACLSFGACCNQAFAAQLHRPIWRQLAIRLDSVIADSLTHLYGEGRHQWHQRPGNLTDEIPVCCGILSLQNAGFKSNCFHAGKPGCLQDSRQHLWCVKSKGTGGTRIRWWYLDVPHHDLHRNTKERTAFWRSPGTDSDPTCWFERCV